MREKLRHIKKRWKQGLCVGLACMMLTSVVILDYQEVNEVQAVEVIVPTTYSVYQVVTTLLGILGISVAGSAIEEHGDAIMPALNSYAQTAYEHAQSLNEGMKPFEEFVNESLEKGAVTVTDEVKDFLDYMADSWSYQEVFGDTDLSNVNVDSLPRYDTSEFSKSIGTDVRIYSCMSSLGFELKKGYFDPLRQHIAFSMRLTLPDGTVSSYMYAISNEQTVKTLLLKYYYSNYGDFCSLVNLLPGAITSNKKGSQSFQVSNGVWTGALGGNSSTVMQNINCNSDYLYELFVNPAYSIQLDTGTGLVLGDESFVDSDPLGQIKQKLEELGKSLKDLSFGSVNEDGELSNDIPICDPTIWEQVADRVIPWDQVIDDERVVVWDPTTDKPIVGELPDVIPDNPDIPKPDPDPTPDPNPDPDNPKPDIDKGSFLADLSALFPFCIPFDLIHAFEVFNADPVAPRIEWTLNVKTFDFSYTFVIDMEKFNSVALVCRVLFLILFIVGLILATRALIKG